MVEVENFEMEPEVRGTSGSAGHFRLGIIL